MPRAPLVAATILSLVASATPHARPQDGAAAGGQQSPAGGTGLIVGHVVDAQTGRGVSGAVVSLRGGPSQSEILPPPGLPTAQAPGLSHRVMATSDGLFVFRDLAPGSYSVTARKPGYVEGAFGRRQPAGATRTIRLADGERLGDVTIPMWKHASITGTVLDEAGDPIVGVEIRAMRRSIVGGKRRFGSPAIGRTDDRGMFRIPMLTPGDYIVALVTTHVAVPGSIIEELRTAMRTPGFVPPPGAQALFEAGASTAGPGSPTAVQAGSFVLSVGRAPALPTTGDNIAFVYPTTFFPSALSSAEAGLISIGSGEERVGADLQVKPVPATRVGGRLVGADGPVPGIVVRLVAAESEGFATDLDSATTISAGDGSFTFLAVPPGSYVLQATRIPRPAAPRGAPTVIQAGSGMTIMSMSAGAQDDPQVSPDPTLWARVPIVVGERPVTDVTVSLSTGGRVSGRVVFEGAAGQPQPEQLNTIAVVVEAADGRSGRLPPTRVDRTGRFTTPGLPGGRYYIRAGNAPAGWTFKGAIVDGRDVSDLPLDLGATDVANVALTFTDRPTQLSGTVKTPQGAVDPDATVLLFPADADLWAGYGSSGRRFRTARAGTTGTYSISGLPSGSYLAIALPDEQTADWQDPRTLEMLARRSTRVEIADGQPRTQDLTTER